MAGFKNSVLGGAETLIRSAIKSFNYVAGIAGWRIAKDGTAELNDATIRGTLLAGGGNVRLSSTGFHLSGNNQQFDINGNAGFLSRIDPDDGSYAQMVSVSNGLANGGVLFLSPATPSAINNTSFDAADVYADYLRSGATDTPYLQLASPKVSGGVKVNGSLLLKGQSSTSATDNSHLDINVNSIDVNGDMTCHADFVTGRPRWINQSWGTPTLLNNTVTTLTPTSVTLNTGNMGSGANVTVPSIDVWDMGLSVRFATNTAGIRQIRISVNGNEVAGLSVTPVASFNTTVTVTAKLLLNAGDVVTFQAYQNSGGSLGIVAFAGYAWVMKEVP
jgi:hypothetical protein